MTDQTDNSVNTHAPSVVQIESSKFIGILILVSSFSLGIATYALAVSNQAKNSAWEAGTQSLLLRDYVDRLRFELASHGINPPEYPAELKGK